MRRLAIFLAVLIPVYGQVTTGSISGYVMDPSGRPIQNAQITVADPGHSVSRTALTDLSGFYRISDLSPSPYRLSGSAANFLPSSPSDVQLQVNAQVRVDLHLAVAGRPQSLTVAAEQAAIPSETSDLGVVIDQERISGLPLNQRNFLQLALLTPGVATPVQGSQNSTRGAFAMHVNGAREEYNNFLLDGVDNNDQDVNRYILEPSVDSIQEFKIETNSYSAEYGRNAGGQVNVITRGGSNEAHGFAYEYLRNRVLDASNSFDQGQKAKLIRNQFGAGVGGPVIKDRTFFFASFDALRGRQGFSQFGTVPTVAERQGDLSALGSPVINPFTGAPFAGNKIPTSSISPLAAKVLALYPLPNLPGLSQNYFSQPVERDTNTQFLGRIDHRFNESSQISFRYAYGREDLFEPFTESSTQLPGFGDYVYDSGHNAMVNYVRSFGPTTLNSLTLGMNRAPRRILQQNYQTDVNKLWGVNYLPTQARDFGYPAINVAGYSFAGDVTQIPIERAATTYQVADTVSIVRGSHGLKFGGDVRKIQQNGILDLLSRGSISFAGAISGSGIGDLLLGYPTFTIQSQSNNPQTQRSSSFDFFAQDDWKVTRKLSLNLGLRYEINTPPTDPSNRMSAFNLATGKIAQVGTPGVSRSGIQPDWNNLAPRLGFAYALSSTTVVRGGYGIFYDAGILVANSAMYFNPPYFNIFVFVPQPSLISLNNPFPSNQGFVPAASLSTLSPNMRTSYIQDWNFNIQHEFNGVGVFSVAYAGSKGTHLLRSLDLNQPTPGPGDVGSRSPYPQYSNIFFEESGANSEYQSLQVSFNRRLARGLTVLGAYTFSKSMDDTSSFLSNDADRNFPQNSHNYRAEHALSSFDVPHRGVVSFVYALPFHNHLLRNFETAGIIVAQSGQPFTPILRFDNSNTGNTGGTFGSDRPNVVGSPSLSNPSAKEWFNTAAFAIPAKYTFGNAGRNILRGPGLATFDLSLSRKFAITDRTALQVQAQAFNLLNRENLKLPNLFADDPANFGKIFSAKDRRQVQLAMRLSF